MEAADAGRGRRPMMTRGFMDLRGWLALLEKENELRRIRAEVDWDREIGAVSRRALEKKGPALLFETIKGYRGGRCTKVLTNALGDRRRLALALGFPKDVGNAELVQYVMKKNRETIPPRVVTTGPVKEGGVRGDAEVPAGAEIVLEGFISDDPATYESEGPFGEFTGYVSDVPTPRPTMKVTCISHRREPIFQGCLEGTLPGSYSENSVMSSVQRAAIAWNILVGAGIPGIRDVYVHPITNGVNVCVKITKHYQGQPKQIAAALWGNAAAQYRYKHVWVVEDDIDVSSYEQIDWAVAHRVNAGEGGIVIFPGSFGSPIDPSTPLEDRNVAQLGTGLWNRVLFDATRNWKFERRAEWGGERFPPTVRPAPEDEARVRERWQEFGLGDL